MQTLLVCVVALSLVPALRAAGEADELLAQARAAWSKKNVTEALELAGKAIATDPKSTRAAMVRGQMYEALGKHDEAVADYDRALKIDPELAEAYQHRGSEQFRRGKIAESLSDFDAYLKRRPEEAPGHWQRGISLYYLGRYDEGRRQFSAYEAKDTNDVENAVWHLMCAARADNIEKARKGMLKIGKDLRVPMMVVYDLFKGTATPADVEAAMEGGEVDKAERNRRRFYGNLYLGLYYDMTGDKKKALAHLELAAGKFRDPQYMADVARVHADLLKKEDGKK